MDFSFKLQPFKHQLEGIEYGLAHDKWLLADQMGLGKSQQTICIADIRKVKHCLIICCTNGLKWNWLNEVHKHSYEEGFILGQRGKTIGNNEKRLEDLNRIHDLPRFIITNIETLRYRIPTGEKVEKVVKRRIKLVDKYRYPITEKLQELCQSGEIDMIVVDEFHEIKNEDTEQAKQVLKISSSIQIAITGTPIENAPLDVFMALKWLGYEKRTFWEFKHRYCKLGGFNGNDVVGYRNLEELTDSFKSIMLRRLKEEVIDLPEMICVDEYVDMNSKQASIYNSVKKNTNASKNPLATITRLRQATGYTGILSDSVKTSSKLDRMEELVSDAVENGHKVVIFSEWSQIVIPAYERLSKKYKGKMITKSVKDSERQENILSFQTDDDVKFIIGTTKAMGKGYDLYEGSVVVFLDEPWNMSKKNQAIERCHRIGTKSIIVIYTLMCKDTIDEKVHAIVERKDAVSNILMEDDSKIDKNTLINYLLS